jgi:predicted amidohydrolase
MDRPVSRLKIAVGQFDVKLFDKETNILKMKDMTVRAKEEMRVSMIVFPECATTGYCLSTAEELHSIAEPFTGESVKVMSGIADETGIDILFGMLESDGDKYYNTVVLCEPSKRISRYRKTHLPFLGVDRFLNAGESLEPLDSRFGLLGVMVAYDLRFPEVAREMTLKDARVLLQPTNLPHGAEAHANVLTKARACENHTFLVSCNRVGEERGFCFIGRSQIVDYNGVVICEMGENEGIMCAEIDLTKAEEKQVVVIPDEYESNALMDRRPELYGSITKPKEA